MDPLVASHKLSIYKEARYISQKKRKLGEERRLAAKVEADKLLNARFIEEAEYTTWLSNVVLVKKANGKWRMCVDYTDLNKACPRDAYPLPNIDRLVDVINMVVKSPSHHQHGKDLSAVFSVLRQYNLCLNPDKCVFGVDGGKFLGFMLTQRGIEANPKKCKAIIEMRSPATIKEVQRLIGRLTAISRFLPKLAEQTQPIVQLLKKSTQFTWTDDCEQILQELKTTLTSPPILHKPDTRQPLLVYITATDHTVSAALVQEIEGTQHPIYFVSRTLQDIKW